MRDVVRARRICRGGIKVEWQKRAYRRDGGITRMGLLECHALIRKSTHSTVTPKIVIERPIFLSQDHHVLDVRQFRATGGARVGRRNNRTPATSVQTQRCQFGHRTRDTELQQYPTSKILHAFNLDAACTAKVELTFMKSAWLPLCLRRWWR
jgi:hypothetical protein